MHYRQVTVKRNETTSVVVHVGDWEVPMLEAKHSSERLTIGELKDFPNRPWPDSPASEMQRLTKLYGVTSAADNAPSFAEEVYGKGQRGIKALAEAIKEAQKTATPKATRKRAAKPDLVGTATA